MKNHYYTLVAAAIILTAPLATHAQIGMPPHPQPPQNFQGRPPMQSESDTVTGADQENEQGGDGQGDGDMLGKPYNASTVSSTTIRARIQADYQNRMQNLRNNQGVRNGLLDARRGDDREGTSTGTSTRPWPPRAIGGPGQMMDDENRQEREGASTMPFRGMNGQDATSTQFVHEMQMRRERMMNDLLVGIANLKQIRGRISSRIDKEVQAGTDVSDAQALLVIADQKLVIAQKAIDALSTATSSMGWAGQQSNQDNDMGTSTLHRMLPNMTSVKEALDGLDAARRALNAVVQAIAHDLGITLDNGTSTPEHP